MNERLHAVLLLLPVSVIYLLTARGSAILDDGDALYAHVAQQMVERKDWVTPYANGVRFLDKPPLMYWLMAVSYQWLGDSEFAARLPSALAVIGTSWLVLIMGGRTRIAAGAAVSFCIGTFLFTRMVFPDMLFVFLLTLAMYSFLRWHSDRSGIAALSFFAALAGALLAKGLIGVAFPAAIIGLFLAVTRGWRRMEGFPWLSGTVLLLLLSLPWHLLAAARNEGFLWYYFVNEQLLRFLGRRQPVDYESIALPAFWLLIPLWLFPWSVFLPAVRHLFGSPRNGSTDNGPIVWLSFSWAAVVLAFFSLSSRLEHYALPLIPPLALLVGIALSPGRSRDAPGDLRKERSVARSFVFLGILGGIILVLAAAALAWTRFGSGGAEMLSGRAAQYEVYKTYFGPLFDLPSETFLSLMTPLLGTATVLPVCLIGAWWLNRRGRRVGAILALSVMMAGFSVFAQKSISICETVLTSKEFGEALDRLRRPGDSVVTIGDYERANSINFYARMPLMIHQGRAAVLEWGLRYPDAPKRILGGEEFRALWNGPDRVFVLSPDSRIAGLGLGKSFLVLQSDGRTLVCNKDLPPRREGAKAN